VGKERRLEDGIVIGVRNGEEGKLTLIINLTLTLTSPSP
jgi:hypothetical protein